MKRTVVILLMLGVILAGAGLGHAATASLNINATVLASGLALTLNPASLSFNAVPGTPTAPQNLITTTTGTGNYQLQLSSTTFTGAGTQPASVLQYRQLGATTWVSATGTPTSILPFPVPATTTGDIRTFEMRLSFPSTATVGNYTATVTITAVAM